MKQFAFTSYLLYFLGGLVITVVGSVLPQILTHYKLSYTMGGQLVLLGSIGFLLGVPISSFLLTRLSEKNLLAIATAMIAVAQLGILFLPPFKWIIFFNFLNGVGVASLEMVVATLMMELFSGRRAVVMSYLEVSFGTGALLMPLVSSLFIKLDNWRYSFLFTGILAIIMILACKILAFNKNNIAKENHKPLDANSSASPVLVQHKKWVLLVLFSSMIFMYAGIESSLNNFLPSIFITYIDTIPSYASLSIGVFWVTMLIGRLATGWIIRKITYERYLLFSIVGTLISLVFFIIFNSIMTAYSLLLLLGLTMSGIYSITMVYANHTIEGENRLVTSFITGFSGLGGAIFPLTVGFTMDKAGTNLALWLITSFGVIYLASLLTIFIIKRKALINYNLNSQCK
ncbi:MFS transporter [Priestia megaterium]|uniref:MFS transporter n=1 Tax=Priestia megaterium TaxID=1404 RepID=UPI00367257E3